MALDTLQRPVVARPSSLMTQDAVPSPKQSSSQPSPPPSALRRRPLAKPKQVRIQLPPSALAAAAAYHLAATDCSTDNNTTTTNTLVWVPPIRIHAMRKPKKHKQKNNKKKKAKKDNKEKDTITPSLANSKKDINEKDTTTNTATKTTPCALTPPASCIPGVVEEPPSETTSGTTSVAIPIPPSPEPRAFSVSPSPPPTTSTITTTTRAPHPVRMPSAWERDQRHKQQEEQRLAQYRELVMFHRIYQHRRRGRSRPFGGESSQDHHQVTPHNHALLRSLMQAQHSSQHHHHHQQQQQQQQQQAVLPPPPATATTTPPPTTMVPPLWPRPRRIPPPPSSTNKNHRAPAPLPSVVWVDPPHSTTDPDPGTTPLGADTSISTTTPNRIPTANTTRITAVPHSMTCDTGTDHGPPGKYQNILSIPSVPSCSTRATSTATGSISATTTTAGWGPVLAHPSLPPVSWTTTGASGTTTMANPNHSWRTSSSSLTVPWTPSGYEITTAPTSLVYSELDGVFQLDL